MVITVASGKGGTGKTTFSVNLANALATEGKDVRLFDCDVEEPNDHLFVKPEFSGEESVLVKKPMWDAEKCTGCGKCAEACNFNAIAVVKGRVLIFNELCHSCGVCSYVCPVDALSEKDTAIGKVEFGTTSIGERIFFAHGTLKVGESLAPRVVGAVKEHIKEDSINIIDAAPGTACPVVEAVDGADAVVLVTEPTPFGLNDLKLAVGLTQKVGAPAGIVINRSDGEDRIIADYAEAIGMPVLGRIPFKREYAETYSKGDILVEHHEELRAALLSIYEEACKLESCDLAVLPEDDAAIIEGEIEFADADGIGGVGKEITVISGKGGTGKTTVVSSFALLSENRILADNDVDAADLHLLIKPGRTEQHTFVGSNKSIIEAAKCISCGKCAEACHFDAIDMNGPANDLVGKTYLINSLACEACGFCELVCPVGAIYSEPNHTGEWFVSDTEHGVMVHAKLGIAEENSGKLVTQVRNKAAELSEKLKADYIISDGPPGTGCPVISSVSGTDAVVVVTEPTVSGVHDMERVMDLCRHFGVPVYVIINKADLNADQCQRIEQICAQNNSRVIASIPFDRDVHNALMEGRIVVEYSDGPAASALRDAWSSLMEALK